MNGIIMIIWEREHNNVLSGHMKEQDEYAAMVE
jgi:hypothetical protein